MEERWNEDTELADEWLSGQKQVDFRVQPERPSAWW